MEHDPVGALCMGSEIQDVAPLPVALGVLDSAVALFGQIFPLVPAKHRLQMFDHFGECIKNTKAGPRQQAVSHCMFNYVNSKMLDFSFN